MPGSDCSVDDVVEGLIERIARVYADVVSPDIPTPDADLLDGHAFDSLTLVEFLFQIEQELGVTIQLEELDLDDIRSLNAIARAVAPTLSG